MFLISLRFCLWITEAFIENISDYGCSSYYSKCKKSCFCVWLILCGALEVLTQHTFAFTAIVTVVIFYFSAWDTCIGCRAIIKGAAPSRTIFIALTFLHTVHKWRALVSIFIATPWEAFKLIVTYIINLFLPILTDYSRHTLVLGTAPTWDVTMDVILARLPEIITLEWFWIVEIVWCWDYLEEQNKMKA